LFKLLMVVFILITFFLLSIFIDGMMKLHKQEEEEKRNIVRDGMLGYLDRTFGFGKVEIFKSMYDADGNESYLVYSPQYEWFNSSYKWYEVNATENGFQHIEVKA
jgi:hypothetical protein